jgi:hypothetical protein
MRIGCPRLRLWRSYRAPAIRFPWSGARAWLRWWALFSTELDGLKLTATLGGFA